MTHAIDVRGLRKTFSSSTAIEDVNFQVERGEIFGFLGPSGSGKTTTIKILTGELRKTAGEMEVLGMRSDAFRSSAFKAKIGILSDNSALYERLTIQDNLKLFCQLYHATTDKIDDVLETVNLAGEKKKPVSKLSRGMKQRVLLAKALIHQPELVFLDEPTSALDPGNMLHIHNGLRKLNEAGTTIFLTTHNMEEATLLCDRVAFLHNGKVKEIGNPEELRYKYSTHAFHIETFDGEELVLANEPGNADRIQKMIAEKQVRTMYTDHPTLGQIFLNITGKELV